VQLNTHSPIISTYTQNVTQLLHILFLFLFASGQKQLLLLHASVNDITAMGRKNGRDGQCLVLMALMKNKHCIGIF
jgi:hypothetical protein